MGLPELESGSSAGRRGWSRPGRLARSGVTPGSAVAAEDNEGCLSVDGA